MLAAIASLPPREQKVIGLYYYGEATMKQIGSEIGVNESRVSQLHARAIRRLRDALERSMQPGEARAALRSAILMFQQKPRMAKATLESRAWASGRVQAGNGAARGGVVVNHPAVARAPRAKAANVGGKRFAKAAAARPVARAVAAR